jgi:hypothetical protein|tara:strand:- start:270 stop:989 length:720 start_codon:yes stop_codon:yes gene_type:complete
MSKYFTVEVKPTITASKQHIGAFSGGDVLFDWTEFEVPKGSARLVGATILVRPQGNAAPTVNNKVMNLVISKSNTQTLGVINSPATNRPSNDLIGNIAFATTDFANAHMASTAVASSPTTISAPIVLTADQNVTSTQGYDKFYIGGLSDAQDFSTINRINGDPDGMGTALVIDGTSMNALEHFLPGDVFHAHDDAVIGTAAVVANGTITLTEAIAASVLADDDFVYNIHPIRIILQFEQ